MTKHDDDIDGQGTEPQPRTGAGAEQAASAAEIGALRGERDRFEVQLQRTLADLANMRKRQAKEIDDARQRAIESMAFELLPVLDNFHAALEVHEKHAGGGESQGVLDGLRMTRSLLEAALSRQGIEEIEAEGLGFDPKLHEAVRVDASSSAEPGTITHVLQRGYRLGDKIVRPSRVVVAAERTANRGIETEGD